MGSAHRQRSKDAAFAAGEVKRAAAASDSGVVAPGGSTTSVYLPRQVLVRYTERGGNFNGAKQQRILDQRQASPGKGGEVLICGPVAAKQAMQGIAVVLGSGEPVRQAQRQFGAELRRRRWRAAVGGGPKARRRLRAWVAAPSSARQ